MLYSRFSLSIIKYHIPLQKSRTLFILSVTHKIRQFQLTKDQNFWMMFSLNCKGIGNKDKRRQCFHFLREKPSSVIFFCKKHILQTQIKNSGKMSRVIKLFSVMVPLTAGNLHTFQRQFRYRDHKILKRQQWPVHYWMQ